jgi:hypothetical protein
MKLDDSDHEIMQDSAFIETFQHVRKDAVATAVREIWGWRPLECVPYRSIALGFVVLLLRCRVAEPTESSAIMFPGPGEHISKYFSIVEGFVKKQMWSIPDLRNRSSGSKDIVHEMSSLTICFSFCRTDL